jgi:hypothetical protein
MERAGVWIPERIYRLPLSFAERIYLAEVASFTDTGRECFASDAHFAERLDCTEQQARRILLALIRGGFLERDGWGGNRNLRISAQVPSGSCAFRREDLREKAQEVAQKSAKVARKGAHTKQYTKQSTKQDTKQGVEMPFSGSDFASAWDQWLEYRRAEFGFKYKSPVTQQTALHSLQKIANNDERTAIEIIGQSIASGWKGFFPLKRANNRVQLTRTGFERHLEGRNAGTNASQWHQRFTGEQG